MSYILKTKYGTRITVESIRDIHILLHDLAINYNTNVYDDVNGMELKVSDILSSNETDHYENNNFDLPGQSGFIKNQKRTRTFIFSSIVLILDLLLLTFNIFYYNFRSQYLIIGDISIPIILIFIFSASVFVLFLLVILISKSINVKANGMVLISIFLFMVWAGQFSVEINAIQLENQKDSAAFAYVDNIIKDMLLDKKPEAVEFDNEDYGDYSIILKQIDEAYVEFFNTKSEYVNLCIELASNVNDNTAAKKNISDILINLDKYESKYSQFLEKFKKAIDDSNISMSQKDKMLKQYYTSLERSRNFYKEYFDIAKNAYNLYDKLVQYRIDNNAHFSTTYNSFIFSAQNKADKYNKMQHELNGWISKEKEWIKRRDNKRRDIINSIEKSK